ncbi:MAG: hypothetical protein ABI134_19405 [Byssovorax sp.]
MRRFALISRSFRRLLFLASITAGAACAPPLQSGGVEVRTGAAERLELLYRWRHGDASGESLGGDPEEAPVPTTSEAGPAAGSEPSVGPPSPAKHQEK